MSSFFSAVVNLSSSKSCFVTLSADLAQRLPNTAQSSGKVVVLQVQWPAGLAFVSWSGEVAINRSVGFGQVQSSTVEISRKFADLNGIQNGDQVVLVPVDSAPSCARLHVDPFTANDWEILELHASFIESNLLNQVRVVWTGQVVPVWINKNTCISIRVGETEPKASCVVLEEFTEVIIAPKQRNLSASKPSENPHSIPSQTKQENTSSSLGQHNHDNQYESSKFNSNDPNCVIKNMTEETYASKLYNLWNSFLYGVDRNHEETSQQESRNTVQCSSLGSLSQVCNAVENGSRNNTERNCCRSVFGKAKLELSLRSQPEMTSKISNLQAIEDRTLKMSCVQPSTVFVNPSSVCFRRLKCERNHSLVFPNDYEGFQKIVTIKKLLSPKEKIEVMESGKRKNDKGSEPIETHTEKMEYLTKSVVVKMVLNKDVFPGQIWMHRLLKQQLGTRGISCFLVHDVTAEPHEIQGIILHSNRETMQMSENLGHEVVIKAFNDWVVTEASSETCPLVVWDGLEVTFSCNGNFFEFLISVLSHNNTEQKLYFKLKPSTLDRIKVVIGDVKHLSKSTNELLQLNTANTAELSCSINDLGGFSQSFHKCLSHLFVSLGKSSLSAYLCGSLATGLSNGAVLIHGSGIHVGEGCGKTSLAHALCHELQRSPICAYVIIIDCIPLRAKRVEIIQRQWQQAFKEAAWHQPAVILLDNLDHVISAPNMAQEMGSEGLYRMRLVQVFKDLVATEVINKSRIALIATSRSQDSLHAALQTGHGSHVFQCQVELGPLNEKQRTEVLRILIKTKFPEVNQADLDTVIRFVSKKCQGFSPKDLSSLADRGLHFSHVRKMECNLSGQTLPVLVPDDFDKAFSGFSPASLHGVELHKPGELSWADVGGLSTVKKSLEETLLWPTKYSGLFSKCPLRLRSGLLLYGPPGTGKTLLAGVVAKETGLNFISIKGPELLSKYIGASEQAVRDIFTRAQTAKPCILFFDEFDSLAPRRGHDSTGVTDRVVNQLLTQLDGVEGLEGVYILAATSRPGLIDPALLRPGRLDKCVYCPIPNKTERLEILQALTRNLSLDDDVNLKELADKCEHFTGADLKALLYNAQLESIHRSTSKLKLYGDISESRDEIKTSVKASKENTEEDKGILVFTTGKGKIPLSKEEEETIQAEANILQQNLYQKDLAQTQVHSDRELAQEKGVICICQSDLDKAALTTRPSVLPKYQLQYENIYDSFVKSRGGSFTKNTPMQEKATLA